jgi:ABC-2 type transport system permease protein
MKRALRFGGYATLVIAAVIAIAAVLNVLIDRLPWRADMTSERFYTLSQQTEKVLAGLSTPIRMLGLWEAGKEDPQVDELLRKYMARSRQLSFERVDPYRNPVRLKQYEVDGTQPAVGSIVLETEGKFRVLRQEDLYVMEQDEYGEMQKTQFVAENALTNGIASVTGTKDPVVYLLRGHGEKDLPALLADRMRRAFYDVRDLSLATGSSVPADAALVVMLSPRQDIGVDEELALREYLRDQGGKALVMTDIGADPQPNLARLLEGYGLAIVSTLVVEGASGHFLPNQPLVLVPNVGKHAITEPNAGSDMPIIFPASQVLTRTAAVRRTVEITGLLASSDRSWAKIDPDDANLEKGPRDVDGPFLLAAAVTDRGELGEKPSRLVVMASSFFLFPSENIGRLEENEVFFMSSLGWLQDRPELISIPARAISSTRYDINLTQSQFFLFGGIAVILLPFAVFAAGLATWLRRRHL